MDSPRIPRIGLGQQRIMLGFGRLESEDYRFPAWRNMSGRGRRYRRGLTQMKASSEAAQRRHRGSDVRQSTPLDVLIRRPMGVLLQGQSGVVSRRRRGGDRMPRAPKSEQGKDPWSPDYIYLECNVERHDPDVQLSAAMTKWFLTARSMSLKTCRG